jgi:hypothetical protein
MKILTIGACVLGLAACTSHIQMSAAPGQRHAMADTLGGVPRFVVLPAADFRPKKERGGQGLEVGMIMVGAGGGMGHSAGASAIDSEATLRWSSNPFVGQPGSASTGIAADVGRSLEAAAERPVSFDARGFDAAAHASPDGTIIVQVVIVHLTRIAPQNLDVEQTKSQQGNYEVTTTRTESEKFGPFWSISYRIQLAEVRGGRVVRKQVRYVTPTVAGEDAYTESVIAAADEIVAAVVNTWTPAHVEPPVSAKAEVAIAP